MANASFEARKEDAEDAEIDFDDPSWVGESYPPLAHAVQMGHQSALRASREKIG
jgi:hypothetical protein